MSDYHGHSDLGALGKSFGLAATGLATGALATASTSIHWSALIRPAARPMVGRPNGATISSVPGTVISYHATGLIPDTSCTYPSDCGSRWPSFSPLIPCKGAYSGTARFDSY